MAVTAGGAIYLAACGGDKGGESGDATSLLSTPADSTSSARAGGVFIEAETREATTWDVSTSTSAFIQGFIGGYAYPRMLEFKAARYPQRPVTDFEGDLAESFELSPDKLQLTFKLKPGLKWDARAPTNGRTIDSQDVMFTWNKFTRLASAASNFVYKPDNPTAPVTSFQATDSRTIVVKLNAPNFNVLPLFAQSAGFYVMPRESESAFDPKGEVRGYGPFVLQDYTPSTRIVWRKNPDYHVKGRPFVDQIERHIMTEYAARHAQFRSGNVHAGGYGTANTVVNQDEIIGTKRDIPALMLRAGPDHTTSASSTLNFGYEGSTPFLDQRVRQAFSMLIDRDAYVDATTNKNRFVAEGLPVELRYPSIMPQGYEGYWLDPQNDKDFGPNAKFLRYDPAEAKKLLAAAGHANGFQTTFLFEGTGRFGTVYGLLAQVLPEMWSAGGVKAALSPIPYAEYIRYRQFSYAGDAPGFNGIGMHQHSGAPTASLMAYEMLHPAGRLFIGAPQDGRDPRRGDSEVTKLIEDMISEFNLEKQQTLAKEYQRLMATRAYGVLPIVSNLGFDLSWPCVGNYGTFRGPAGSSVVTSSKIHFWIDSTKPPLSKS